MPNQRRYATEKETRIALEALTKEDISDLLKDASYFSKGTDYVEPDELLNEAYARCLGQHRRWPRNVVMKTFLYFLMKSLASKDHLPQSHIKECSLQEFENKFGIDAISYLGGTSPSAEEIHFHIAYQRDLLSIARKIREHFEDDVYAIFIIDSWLSGMEKIELINEKWMSEKEYDAARKRISRHLKTKRTHYRNQLG